jgi:hypothetical protein
VKRRVDDDAAAVPPAGLVDYRAWARERGLAPYGNPADPVSMRAAASQWYAWEAERAAWAAAHGIVEVDLPTSGCGAPFDPDSI